MGHAIEENDRMIVGYCEMQGLPWHNHPNCNSVDGIVDLQLAREIFDYPVELQNPFVEIQGEKIVCDEQVLVVDIQQKSILSYVAGRANSYALVQPLKWFDTLTSLVMDADNKPDDMTLEIESCGTLFNRAERFLNFQLMEHVVKGDISPTQTRLLVTDSYRGQAATVGLHQTRVVCNNTVRMARAQSQANNTFEKIRHTKNFAEHLAKATIDLAELVGGIADHNKALDRLAEITMNGNRLEQFLSDFAPIKPQDEYKNESAYAKAATKATNLREAIQNEYETAPDLEAIPHTAYRLFNAVTSYYDHGTNGHKNRDSFQDWQHGLFGSHDDKKQQAFDLLLAIN